MDLCIAFHNKQETQHETRQEAIETPATPLPTKHQPPFLILFYQKMPRDIHSPFFKISFQSLVIKEAKGAAATGRTLYSSFVFSIFWQKCWNATSKSVTGELLTDYWAVPNFLTNGELRIFLWINCIYKLKTIHSMVYLTKQHGPADCCQLADCTFRVV